MSTRRLFCVVGAACLVSHCAAQQLQSTDSPAVRRVPVAVAWAKIVSSGHDSIRFERGPWIPYHESEVSIARQTLNAFDQVEYSFDTSGNLVLDQNPAYGATCSPPFATPSVRQNLGDNFSTGLYYNDMKTVGAAAGKSSTRCGFCFKMKKPLYATNLAVFVATTEKWVTTLPGANDPSSAGRGDNVGVMFSYGGYVSDGAILLSDVDLTGTGLSIKLPTSGSGGTLSVPGDFDSINNTMSISKGQMMLWTLKPNNPSATEHPYCWIDAEPATGAFVNDDYADMDFSATSACQVATVYGPMLCFFYDPGGATKITPVATNVLLGSIVSGDNSSLVADDSNPLKICKAFVPSLSSPRIRFESDFVSPFATPTNIVFGLKARMTTGGVFAVRAFLADRSGGSFIYGAANQILGDSTLNTNYSTFTTADTGVVSRHVAANLTMRSRVEIQQTGFSAAAIPCAEFERLDLTLTP